MLNALMNGARSMEQATMVDTPHLPQTLPEHWPGTEEHITINTGPGDLFSPS